MQKVIKIMKIKQTTMLVRKRKKRQFIKIINRIERKNNK